jgi:hypothetical protein
MRSVQEGQVGADRKHFLDFTVKGVLETRVTQNLIRKGVLLD